MTTPTSNPVPSAAPQDLLFNAEVLDAVVTGSAVTVTDRRGISRMSMQGAIDTLKAFNPRGAWLTGTAYALKDVVVTGGIAYAAVLPHTAGTFATDLAAGRWVVHQGVVGADLASTASGKGAALVGVEDQQPVTAQDLLVTAATEINVLRYMPPAEWAGILAGTSTYNAQAAFQAAIDTKKPLYAPGVYKISGQLNFANLLSLRGDGTNGGSTAGSGCVFDNTGTAPAVVVPGVASRPRSFASVADFFFKGASWDAVTGANGHGIDIASQITLTRVQVIGFKKIGVYLHHDATSNGPYQAQLVNVRAIYNGQHGIVVGRGGNVVTLFNVEAKWNGAPSWLTAPTVLGSYDGVYVDDYDDGSGYPAYNPEALTIIGGDCSYNSRYGWNFVNTSYSKLAPMYAEFNLAAYDCHVGQLQNSLVDIGRVLPARVNLAQTFSAYQPFTSVYIGGKSYGAGNTNTAPQGNYANNNLRTVFSEDPTRAKTVLAIPDVTTGDLMIAGFGGAVVQIGSGSSETVSMKCNMKLDGLNTTGATTATLGANAPALAATTPYKWIRVLAADGTPCVMPVWRL